MKKALALAVLCLTLAPPAGAQQPKKRIVNVGGGPGDMAERTAAWPRAALKADMSDADRSAALDALLAALTQGDLFSGSVEVARDGESVYRKAFGLASRDWNVPNRPDTLFNIGSINKAFTQLAIKLLAKDRALSLDDTIAKALPDYTGAGRDGITVRQLLNHTSGMGDIFNENWRKTPRNRLRTLADYRPLFENEPLQSEPGARQSYSNAGYVLLGLMIEKASGKPYETFVKERIFDKIGMKSTGFPESDAIVPNRATGYMRRAPNAPANELRSNIHQLPGKGSSAGGGESTVDDLVLFADSMRRNAFGLDKPEAGLGIAGGLPGANAALETCANGITIAALSNVDPPSAEYAAGQARKLFGCGGD
jgi:CubicO group peptidase (beta-lactamase class C family)